MSLQRPNSCLTIVLLIAIFYSAGPSADIQHSMSNNARHQIEPITYQLRGLFTSYTGNRRAGVAAPVSRTQTVCARLVVIILSIYVNNDQADSGEAIINNKLKC